MFTVFKLDTLGGVIVSKLDWRVFTSEFEFNLVPDSYGLLKHVNRKIIFGLKQNYIIINAKGINL